MIFFQQPPLWVILAGFFSFCEYRFADSMTTRLTVRRFHLMRNFRDVSPRRRREKYAGPVPFISSKPIRFLQRLSVVKNDYFRHLLKHVLIGNLILPHKREYDRGKELVK